MSCAHQDEMRNYRFVEPRIVERKGAIKGYDDMEAFYALRDEERTQENQQERHHQQFGGQFNELEVNVMNQTIDKKCLPPRVSLDVEENCMENEDQIELDEEKPVVTRFDEWLKREKECEREKFHECAEEPQCVMDSLEGGVRKQVNQTYPIVICYQKNGIPVPIEGSPHLLFCVACKRGNPYGGRFCIHPSQGPTWVDDVSCPVITHEQRTESEVLGPIANQWLNSEDKLLGSGRGRGGRKGRGKGKGRRGRSRMGRPQTVFNRGRDFAPSRLRTHLDFDLRFTAPAATVLAPWSIEAVVATNPNNFTTVSTPVPGYTLLAGLYRKYRVRSFKMRYSVINNEAFGIEAFLCPVNFLPSVVTDPTRYLSQGVCTRKIVSAKGGMDNAVLVKSSSVVSFGGSANTTVEDAYVGTTDNTSPPVDNIYFIYGFMTNGVASVAGATNIIHIRVLIDFFELQSPAT